MRKYDEVIRSMTNQKPNNNQIERIERIREIYKTVTKTIFDNCNDSLYLDEAVKNLELSLMLAVKSIVLNCSNDNFNIENDLNAAGYKKQDNKNPIYDYPQILVYNEMNSELEKRRLILVESIINNTPVVTSELFEIVIYIIDCLRTINK